MIIETFGKVSTQHLPDVHQLDARKQVLWVLTASKADQKLQRLTAAQLSEILASYCGIAISRQKIMAILKKERVVGTVVMTQHRGLAYFQIMHRGEEEILHTSAKPIFIEPGKALTSIRTVEEVLRSLQGDIRICDAYVDTRTLDYLAQIKGAAKIQLLTENVQDSGRLKRDLAAFEKEHLIPIELRVCASGQLHDRYVLHAGGMLLVGASFKDIGRKQSMIVALSQSFARDVERSFGRVWSNASKFN
jgi:hypothetical protein